MGVSVGTEYELRCLPCKASTNREKLDPSELGIALAAAPHLAEIARLCRTSNAWERLFGWACDGIAGFVFEHQGNGHALRIWSDNGQVFDARGEKVVKENVWAYEDDHGPPPDVDRTRLSTLSYLDGKLEEIAVDQVHVLAPEHARFLRDLVRQERVRLLPDLYGKRS